MTDAEIDGLTGQRPSSYVPLPEAKGLGDDPDLGLERILGKNDLVNAWFLEAGARAARAVGRVRIGGAQGVARGYGTGSLVGPRLLLTNHHVLPDTVAAASSAVEFGFEVDPDGRDRVGVAFLLRPDVLFLTDPADDGLDFTLVAVAPTGERGADLEPFGWNRAMEGDDPVLVRQYVNIIQHPQGRPKQVALRDNQVIDLLDDFLHYRADTEPGSSGAPVFNDYWELVGLHHSGVPRRDPATKRPLTRWGAPWDGRDERDVDWLANEGVRLSRILERLKAAPLQGEGRRLRDAAFSFEPDGGLPARRIPPVPEPEESEPVRQPIANSGPPLLLASGATSGTYTFNIPLQVQVQVRLLGSGGTDAAVVATAAAPIVASAAPDFGEAVSIDPDYSNRLGYAPKFLGPGPLRVELPGLSGDFQRAAARLREPAPGTAPFELKYHHYSAVLHRSRRLAIFTAVNIEGDRAQGLTRETDRWILDPRVDREAQVGGAFYQGTPFDKGHLVRRIDPAWGADAAIAKVANDDTFHFTNCAPQHRSLNRGLELWRGLEDFLIQRAVDDRRRITVFTGPVFDRDRDARVAPDPEHAGVRVPRWYWKVAVVARPGGTLGALGFLVSQADLVDRAVSDLRSDEAAVDVAATFQVPVSRIAELTGLDFGPLSACEAPSVAGFGREAGGILAGGVRLTAPEEIVIPWADR
jgi:endonuclease G